MEIKSPTNSTVVSAVDKISYLRNVVLENSDAFLINSDFNRAYITGMHSSAGFFLCFKDSSYLIIDSRYIEKAQDDVKCSEVIQQKKIYEQIDELLSSHGARNLVIETFEMTVHAVTQLQKKLSNIYIKKEHILSETLMKMRSVKTDEEAELISKAQCIAEKALEETKNFIGEKSEREIANILDFKMKKYGAEAISFDTIVLSGSRTSLPHGVPSDRIANKGEFILIDFGAVYGGYHSDMTRTFCYGQPSEKMCEVYEIVLGAQELAISKIQPCLGLKDLDGYARGFIENKGYGEYFSHSLGHGVGLEIHEKPNVVYTEKDNLKVGNVITIEPGIYIPKQFGVRIEDFGIVTESGFNNFSKTSKKLQII